MQQQIIGWDIGGAHLKAALLDKHGKVRDIALYSCPLWKGMDYLRQAVQAVLLQFQCGECRHALTMTGELVDLFAGREQGVREIVAAMHDFLSADNCWIYAGQRGFLSANKSLSKRDCLDIASMNWLASASLAAQRVDAGLFVDIGSTTTDILLFADDKVAPLGSTDYQRLVSSELVYTGIVRTPVMALSRQATFKGQTMGLMAEYFATMADVYRLTGDLKEMHDQSETADGGEKTPSASARRLSRMTGYDFVEEDWSLWLDFAQHLKDIQKRQIAEGCLKQLSRLKRLDNVQLVGAGIGRFLVKEIADEFGYVYRDFNELIGDAESGMEVDSGDCAPAVAVASLALGVC